MKSVGGWKRSRNNSAWHNFSVSVVVCDPTARSCIFLHAATGIVILSLGAAAILYKVQAGRTGARILKYSAVNICILAIGKDVCKSSSKANGKPPLLIFFDSNHVHGCQLCEIYNWKPQKTGNKKIFIFVVFFPISLLLEEIVTVTVRIHQRR